MACSKCFRCGRCKCRTKPGVTGQSVHGTPCQFRDVTVRQVVAAGVILTDGTLASLPPGLRPGKGQQLTMDCEGRLMGSTPYRRPTPLPRRPELPAIPHAPLLTSQRPGPVHAPFNAFDAFFPLNPDDTGVSTPERPRRLGFHGTGSPYLWPNPARLKPPEGYIFNAENGTHDTITGVPDHPGHKVWLGNSGFKVVSEDFSYPYLQGHRFPVSMTNQNVAIDTSGSPANDQIRTRWGMPDEVLALVGVDPQGDDIGWPYYNSLTLLLGEANGVQNFGVMYTPESWRSLLDGHQVDFPPYRYGSASPDILHDYSVREQDGTVHNKGEYLTLNLEWHDWNDPPGKKRTMVATYRLGGGFGGAALAYLGHNAGWTDQNISLGRATIGGSELYMDLTDSRLQLRFANPDTGDRYATEVRGGLYRSVGGFNQGGGRIHHFVDPAPSRDIVSPIRAGAGFRERSVEQSTDPNNALQLSAGGPQYGQSAAVGDASGRMAVIVADYAGRWFQVFDVQTGAWSPQYTLTQFLTSLGFVAPPDLTSVSFLGLFSPDNRWDWPLDRTSLKVELVLGENHAPYVLMLGLYDGLRDTTDAQWRAVGRTRPRTRGAYNALKKDQRPPAPAHGLVLADISYAILPLEDPPPLSDDQGNPIEYDPPIQDGEFTYTLEYTPEPPTKKGVYPYLRPSKVEFKRGGVWNDLPGGASKLRKHVAVHSWADQTDDSTFLGPGQYRVTFEHTWAWPGAQAGLTLIGRMQGDERDMRWTDHPNDTARSGIGLGRGVSIKPEPFTDGGGNTYLQNHTVASGFWPFLVTTYGTTNVDDPSGPPQVVVTVGPGCRLSQLLLAPVSTFDSNNSR